MPHARGMCSEQTEALDAVEQPLDENALPLEPA
jgi:hypothetical protein